MDDKKKRPSKNQKEWAEREARLTEFITTAEKLGYEWKSDIIPQRPKRITEKALEGLRALTPAELMRQTISVPKLNYLPEAKDIIQTTQLPTSTLSGKTEYKNFDFTPADVKGFNDIQKLYYKEAKRVLRFYQNAENKGYFWNDADKFYPKNPAEATAEDVEAIQNLKAKSLYHGAQYFEYDENEGGNGQIVSADTHQRNIRNEARRQKREAEKAEQARKEALHQKRVEAGKKGAETRKRNLEEKKRREEEEKNLRAEAQNPKEPEKPEEPTEPEAPTEPEEPTEPDFPYPVLDIEGTVREMLEDLRQHEISNSKYYIDWSGDAANILLSAFNDRVVIAEENGTYNAYMQYLESKWDILQATIDDALMTSDGPRKQQDFAKLMEILADGAVTMEEAQAVEDLSEFYADSFEMY